MTIKDMEALAGVTKANIRFYETEGLLKPKRGDNNYREYGEGDLKTLQQIKFLRLLGVSISSIRGLQNGSRTLSELMEERILQVETEIAELSQTTQMCEELKAQTAAFQELDVTLLSLKLDLLKRKGRIIMKQDRMDKIKRMDSLLTNLCRGFALAAVVINGVSYFGGYTLPVAVQFVFVGIVFLAMGALIIVKNLKKD